MGKYEALPQFLIGETSATRRMSFSQIERILGFKLPKSAYEYEAWWSNNATGHSHSRAWLAAGWRTAEVSLTERKVTFQRTTPIQAAPLPKHDRWGCMAGTITLVPGVDFAAPSGESWNAEQGRLLNE